MKALDRIKAAWAAWNGKNPYRVFGGPDAFYSGGLTTSASTSDYLDAYRGWVYAAVRVISNTAAAGRIRFYTEDSSGKKQYLDKTHPLAALFNRPNDIMSRWFFWHLTMSWLELTGKAYWLKVRDGMGLTRMLLPLQPNWMKVVPDDRELIKGYILEKSGMKLAFEKNEIVYLRYPHPADMWDGMSPLAAAAYSYDSDLAMHKFDNALFANGGSIKGVLQTDEYVGPEESKRLRDEWKRIYGGVDKAKSVAVLHSGLKYQPIQLTPEELDFAEGRRFTRQEIFAIFGVSEGLCGMVEDVNKTNNIALMDSFIRFTMQPKAYMLRDQVDMDLTNEIDEQIETEFELPKAEDALEEHSKMEYRLRNKVTVINEERERLDLEPVEWGEKPWGSFSDQQIGNEPPPAAEGKQSAGIILGRDMAEEKKEILRRGFLNLHGPQEKRFSRTMIDVFDRQRKEVLANMRKTLSGRAYDPALVDFILFDLSRWNKMMGKEIEPRYYEAIKAAIVKELAELGFKGTIDYTSPLIQAYINEKKFAIPKLVNNLTHDKLRQVLRDAFRANKGIEQIATEINAFFDGQNPVRAMLIARTEVTAATNTGIIESFRQTGMVETKAWMTARDERVRITHYESEHSTLAKPVPYDEPFRVGGSRMMHPGDTSYGAPVSEVANCRCFIVPMEVN